jgi:hypothetical protein
MPRLNAFTNRIIVGKGLIRIQNFIFNKIISSNTQNYNLRNDAVAAGWNGISPLVATITVNSGVYVWSDDTAIAGFDTGSMPAGSSMNMTNNGFIIGKGGNASINYLTPNGQDGGPAMNISCPVSITNNSFIAGGGGAGGMGAYNNTGANTGANGFYVGGGGGAGGGSAGVNAGGAVGVVGAGATTILSTNPTRGNPTTAGQSGGGGGRILPAVNPSPTYGTSFAFNVATANSASGRGGEAGGGGASAAAGGVNSTKSISTSQGARLNEPGGEGNSSAQFVGDGGGGGGWGAVGGSGKGDKSNIIFSNGGAGGKAVNLNGNTVTWLANGSRWGAIS